jgi:hypothetical protein
MSVTKNLAGLHDAIRLAYTPGTTLRDFEVCLPRRLESRRLVIIGFFLATRVLDRTEYVVEGAPAIRGRGDA